MKNILTKFHLNITTYLFFLIAFLCGYFKETILIFSIVFLHECGHVITILLCQYKVLKVELYPFGGMTKIDKPINSSINKEMLISLSGICMQLILYPIAYIILEGKTYQTFLLYNTTIILFNLLPIIPLDGSIFFHSLFEKFFPYQKAFQCYKVLSVICFFLFIYGNYKYKLDNYFICLVLFFQFLTLKKEEKYLIQRFYLERYLHTFPSKKIENHYQKDIKVLKKETTHFFYDHDSFKNEKEVLKEKFAKRV